MTDSASRESFERWSDWWQSRRCVVGDISPPLVDSEYARTEDAEAEAAAQDFYAAYLPLLEDLYPGYYTEAEPLADADTLERHHALVSDAFPGVPLLATLPHHTPSELDALADVVDIWAAPTWSSPAVTAFYRTRATAGDEIWPLLDDDLGPSVALRTRSLLWTLYDEDFGGVSLGSVINPWTRVRRVHGDTWVGTTTLFWPGEAAVYGDVSLEHLRDGLEDHALLRYAADAEVDVSEALRAVTGTRYQTRTDDPDVLLDAREQIADALESR